ncbi:hypothetical protein GCM10010420_35100 [Streptomyces glaucosporus]|uniref:Methyltransferase n=1 Tax=Streptomyces glaucosporus TaxID=284044 RepID=A0ABN3IGX0_9ACTN
MAPLPNASAPVRIMEVSGEDYRRAFELFLAGTDEKAVTHEYLTELVERLPRRGLFLDVGAGNGVTTRHVGRYFERVVAVEPSGHMRRALRRRCPDAVVLPEPVDRLDLDLRPDLVLCSHVLYYLPEEEWEPTVRRLLGWVAPGGELVVVLQNPENDCMRMVRHFTPARFDLSGLAGRLAEDGGGTAGDVLLETLPVRYRATGLAEAVDVAELMVNVPSLRDRDPLPSRQDLADYLLAECSDPQGGITVTHTHDVLRVRRARSR